MPQVTWYLSGPMSGIEGHNYPAFAQACRQLRLRGMTIVSPHELKHDDRGEPGSIDWTQYLRGDVMALMECDGIILLPGWSKSKGARLELHIALSMEMPVKFYDQHMDLLLDMER